jgi:hypothetical protein
VRFLALIALAAAAAPATTISTAHTVTALGATGNLVAYAMSDCGVRVWNRAAKKVVAFGRGPACEQTSTGTEVSAVSVLGGRVLYVHFTGGNDREWSLWTATTTAPKPKRLAFVVDDPSDPAPIVLGEAGSVLPYAVGTVVTGVEANGARAFRWTAPGRVTALAAHDTRVAVAVDDGSVYLLNGEGTVIRSVEFGHPLDALALTGSVVVGQFGRSLVAAGKTYALAKGTKLVDAEGSRAVLAGGGSVRTLDLATGAGTLVGKGSLAQTEPGALVVANGRTLTGSRF